MVSSSVSRMATSGALTLSLSRMRFSRNTLRAPPPVISRFLLVVGDGRWSGTGPRLNTGEEDSVWPCSVIGSKQCDSTARLIWSEMYSTAVFSRSTAVWFCDWNRQLLIVLLFTLLMIYYSRQFWTVVLDYCTLTLHIGSFSPLRFYQWWNKHDRICFILNR